MDEKKKYTISDVIDYLVCYRRIFRESARDIVKNFCWEIVDNAGEYYSIEHLFDEWEIPRKFISAFDEFIDANYEMDGEEN